MLAENFFIKPKDRLLDFVEKGYLPISTSQTHIHIYINITNILSVFRFVRWLFYPLSYRRIIPATTRFYWKKKRKRNEKILPKPMWNTNWRSLIWIQKQTIVVFTFKWHKKTSLAFKVNAIAEFICFFSCSLFLYCVQLKLHWVS